MNRPIPALELINHTGSVHVKSSTVMIDKYSLSFKNKGGGEGLKKGG